MTDDELAVELEARINRIRGRLGAIRGELRRHRFALAHRQIDAVADELETMLDILEEEPAEIRHRPDPEEPEEMTLEEVERLHDFR